MVWIRKSNDREILKMKDNIRPVKRLYTPKEAAEYLGHTVSGLRTLLKNGDLPFLRNGESRNGKQYIDIRDMDAFIEGRSLNVAHARSIKVLPLKN